MRRLYKRIFVHDRSSHIQTHGCDDFYQRILASTKVFTYRHTHAMSLSENSVSMSLHRHHSTTSLCVLLWVLSYFKKCLSYTDILPIYTYIYIYIYIYICHKQRHTYAEQLTRQCNVQIFCSDSEHLHLSMISFRHLALACPTSRPLMG
jgi:hypothetical protein